MKKKQVLYIVLALIFSVLLLPKSVDAQGNNKVLTCEYNYKNNELIYEVYEDGKVNLPFSDRENNIEKEWYHGANFDSIFLSSTKTSKNNAVCPTISIDETAKYITIYNNPRTEEDCNGTCTTLKAKNNAVEATVVLNSVGIYNDVRYFLPYFRLLEDGTKEWSIDGKTYGSIDENITLKTGKDEYNTITLSDDFKDSLFKENVNIYRCISKNDDKYVYTFTTSDKYCETKDLSEKDGQAFGASSYHGSLGDDYTTKEQLESFFGDDNVNNCGAGGILGDPSDPDSVAWLLQKLLNYLRAIGPMIVIVMSGIEFTKVIISSDDDGMKKAQKKLITRLILVAALFFIPTIVIALLDLFGMSNDPTCGLK